MLHRLEIILKPELEDPEGIKALKNFHSAGFTKVNNIRTQQVYSIDSPQITSTEELSDLAMALFVDPVLNTYTANQFNGDTIEFDWYVEIGFKAGVTDNAGKVAQENLELQLKEKEE